MFTGMNGFARRGLSWWMARATSSLPVPLSPSMSTVLDTGAICSILTSTSRIASLSPISPVISARRAPLEDALDAVEHLVHVHRLRPDLDVAERAEAIAKRGIVEVGEADDGRPLPQLPLHELHVRLVDETAGEHDDVGLLLLDGGAQVVVRRHDLGLDAGALEADS